MGGNAYAICDVQFFISQPNSNCDIDSPKE